MEAPKRIRAWITGIQPLQGNAGLWRSDEGTITDDEYILAAEHERLMAEKDAEIATAMMDGYDMAENAYRSIIAEVKVERNDWRSRAEFAEAKLEALLAMLPPPEPDLLKKRLIERREQRTARLLKDR